MFNSGLKVVSGLALHKSKYKSKYKNSNRIGVTLISLNILVSKHLPLSLNQVLEGIYSVGSYKHKQKLPRSSRWSVDFSHTFSRYPCPLCVRRVLTGKERSSSDGSNQPRALPMIRVRIRPKAVTTRAVTTLDLEEITMAMPETLTTGRTKSGAAG